MGILFNAATKTIKNDNYKGIPVPSELIKKEGEKK